MTFQDTKQEQVNGHNNQETDTNATQKVSTEEDTSKFISITEAAQINKVTRQAIYVAVQNGKLPARKSSKRWMIQLSDLEEYKRNKYSRKKSTYQGELLFDNAKGFYSVNDIAKKLGVKPQKIYYATRVGLLPASRRGSAWVIHIDDALGYQEKLLQRKSTRSHHQTGEQSDHRQTAM